jgi:ATP-dependent Clp protease ATP-binding subunit ClpA
MEWLVRFTVREEGIRAGGLSAKQEKDICNNILREISGLNEIKAGKILVALASRCVMVARGAGQAHLPSLGEFVNNLTICSETLGGIPVQASGMRLSQVTENFSSRLTSPDMLRFFKEHLVGQDHALDLLSKRLSTEALTRSLSQPLRYCAQGTPGNGKSESAMLLARYLGIPYVNIDAASIPNIHTASTQFFGSARGLVGSYRAGRLEEIAREHRGAVVEISDLDHALPNVRGPMADLFLQILESGQAQAANGARFSCANLIFAFTINLPGGKDHAVRKQFGFGAGLDEDEVKIKVNRAIGELFSSAFLSRIGEPILFAELDEMALATVIERATVQALDSAMERLGFVGCSISIKPETGLALLKRTMDRPENARACMEVGRNAAVEAISGIVSSTGFAGQKLMASCKDDGRLCLELLQD